MIKFLKLFGKIWSLIVPQTKTSLELEGIIEQYTKIATIHNEEGDRNYIIILTRTSNASLKKAVKYLLKNKRHQAFSIRKLKEDEVKNYIRTFNQEIVYSSIKTGYIVTFF